MDGKRTAHEAGLGPGNDRPAKSFRIEDFLESMDPSVRIKLRSMFDDGMLQAEDLDERNVAELRKFDAAVALEILEHYSQADFSTVRNRRAYLAGALKRKAHLANKQQLQPEVQAKLNQLMTAGSIRGGDLDKGCMDTLANLPPATAIAVLERYGGHDFSEVRNPSALFISTVKSVAGPEATAAARGYGPPPGSHSRSSGGPYGAPSGSYSSGSAAASAGGPTPRSYPGYPSLGGADHPGSRRSGGYDGGYDRYEDDHQPPPPPRQQQQYAAAGGIGLLGGAALAAGGPVSADGLPLLAGGGLIQPPGVQLVAPGGLAGVPPGTVIMAAGVGGVQQQYIVSAGGMLTPVPPGATVIGGAIGGGFAVQAAAPAVIPAAAAAAAPPPGVPPEWAAGRKQYGTEQGQLGVRTAEFHGLSPFAVFVHPSPALKLQQLWDDGNELVSMLDDKVWQVLAELPAPEALAIIDDAGQALLNPHAQIRNINAYFMSVVRKVVPGHLPGHPPGHQGPPGRAGYGGRGYDRYDSGGDDHYGGRGGGGFRGGFRGRGRGPPGGGRGGGWHGGGDDGNGDGGGYRTATPRAPGIHLLPPAQRAKAEELCRDHAPLLRAEHFDEGVVATLERLPHDDALAVLDELGGNSMAGVRNLPAYIMGICKRYIRGEAGVGAVGGGRGGGRGAGPVPHY
ncbi:hypothetical protein OEZ86_008606 [Tetradesmus obliquus]|nr:hypothetical protein OEZ86_008606 [Tetradesmus obliquus]